MDCGLTDAQTLEVAYLKKEIAYRKRHKQFGTTNHLKYRLEQLLELEETEERNTQ